MVTGSRVDAWAARTTPMKPNRAGWGHTSSHGQGEQITSRAGSVRTERSENRSLWSSVSGWDARCTPDRPVFAAFIACTVPARIAARVDPIIALRGD